MPLADVPVIVNAAMDDSWGMGYEKIIAEYSSRSLAARCVARTFGRTCMFPPAQQILDTVLARDGDRSFTRIGNHCQGTTAHRQPSNDFEDERRPPLIKRNWMRLVFRAAELGYVEQGPGLLLRIRRPFDNCLPKRPKLETVVNSLTRKGVAHRANLTGRRVSWCRIGLWNRLAHFAKVIRDFIIHRDNCVKNTHGYSPAATDRHSAVLAREC